MGGPTGNIVSFKGYFTAGGRIETANLVDQGALSGSIGADDSQYFMFLNLKIYAVNGNQSPESFS